MAQIWHCCCSGCRPAATAPIRPLAWELPYAVCAALKRPKKKKKEEEKFGDKAVGCSSVWTVESLLRFSRN